MYLLDKQKQFLKIQSIWFFFSPKNFFGFSQIRKK